MAVSFVVKPIVTLSVIKLEFHDTDTDILADSPDTSTSLREYSRGCRCRCWRRGIGALQHLTVTVAHWDDFHGIG